MSVEYLLGIDVGTTTCKAAVVALDGAELAQAGRPTPWRSVSTGAEVDGLELADAATGAALDALGEVPPGTIRGVGITGMGETGFLVGADGTPRAGGIAWHDTRGEDEAARLGSDLGASEFAAHTGLPLGAGWTIVKYPALGADPRPEDRWLSVAEWVAHRLGGDRVAEPSLASRTGFLDVTTRTWWSAGLRWAGIPQEVAPPLVAAGTPIGRVPPRIPELTNAVITVAGHDQPCGAVGAGAVGPGDTLDSCGTAEAILRAVPTPIDRRTAEAATARGLQLGAHVVPEQGTLLGFFKGGLALKRFLRLLGAEDVGPLRDALDRQATSLPGGSGGLVVDGIADDLASVTGIGPDASPGALWRAAVEAAARESARIVAAVDEVAGPTRRLVVAGGWTRSPAYLDIKRQTQGPFDVPDVVAAAARGAALFGGLAAGAYAAVEEFPQPGSHTL